MKKNDLSIRIRIIIFFKKRTISAYKDMLYEQLDFLNLSGDSTADIQLYSTENYLEMYIKYNMCLESVTYQSFRILAKEIRSFLSNSIIKDTIVTFERLIWESPVYAIGTEEKFNRCIHNDLCRAFKENKFLLMDKRFAIKRNAILKNVITSERKFIWRVPLIKEYNPFFNDEQLRHVVYEVNKTNCSVFRHSCLFGYEEELWIDVIIDDVSVNGEAFLIWLFKNFGIITDFTKCRIVEPSKGEFIYSYMPFQIKETSQNKVRTKEQGVGLHLAYLSSIRTGFFLISLLEAINYLACLMKYVQCDVEVLLESVFNGFEIDGKLEKSKKLYDILKQNTIYWSDEDLYENFMPIV